MKRHTNKSEASFIYDPKPEERRQRWRNFGILLCMLFTDAILGIGAVYLMKFFDSFPWYIKVPMQIIVAADIFAAHLLLAKAIPKADDEF